MSKINPILYQHDKLDRGVDKVKPNAMYGLSSLSECWHFDNDATNKIDDDLTEHGGLLHVLPLAIHLRFFLLDK